MGDVVARASEPALAAIKLAWWRERLEELDQGKIPAEPRLQAVALELLTRGISGAEVAGLEAGWASWLENPPDTATATEYGPYLFRLAVRLLNADVDDAIVGPAGRLFVMVDAARRGLHGVGPARTGLVGARIPRRARPLTAFAALAVRDQKQGGPPFEPEGTPGRAWTLLRHRLSGRLPRV